MSDLFPGFAERRISTPHAEIYLRIGGDGPPLMLLHGFPQTHVMWHRVAPALARRFTLVIPDLRGYGRSSCPPNDAENRAYSKRAMGEDVFAALSALGHERFAVAGHDRGARVGYRMALDDPQRVRRLAVLDIIPTYDMWHAMDRRLAMKVYHWQFLAQPAPLPERLIGVDPGFYLEWTMASWTKMKSVSAFDPRALADYRECFSSADHIHAACNDYRAGATYDLSADEADRRAGRRIECPTLALWGDVGIPGDTDGPQEVWHAWCRDLQTASVDSGHFLAEEAPEETAEALTRFFALA